MSAPTFSSSPRMNPVKYRLANVEQEAITRWLTRLCLRVTEQIFPKVVVVLFFREIDRL